MKWKIIDSGRCKAEHNMLKDAQLLETLSQGDAVLHLYDWEQDAATFGHFIDPQRYFHMEKVREKKLDLARRPTGGGIVFHIADFAFSILIPSTHAHFSLNPLDNYRYINEKVGLVLKAFLGINAELLSEEDKENRELFCMAKPTKYDLLLDGKKIGGAAQRKTRLGYLHQGSLLLGHLSSSYLEEILKEKDIIEKIHRHSHPLLGDNWSKEDLSSARNMIKQLFKKIFI